MDNERDSDQGGLLSKSKQMKEKTSESNPSNASCFSADARGAIIKEILSMGSRNEKTYDQYDDKQREEMIKEVMKINEFPEKITISMFLDTKHYPASGLIPDGWTYEEHYHYLYLHRIVYPIYDIEQKRFQLQHDEHRQELIEAVMLINKYPDIITEKRFDPLYGPGLKPPFDRSQYKKRSRISYPPEVHKHYWELYYMVYPPEIKRIRSRKEIEDMTDRQNRIHHEAKIGRNGDLNYKIYVDCTHLIPK